MSCDIGEVTERLENEHSSKQDKVIVYMTVFETSNIISKLKKVTEMRKNAQQVLQVHNGSDR